MECCHVPDAGAGEETGRIGCDSLCDPGSIGLSHRIIVLNVPMQSRVYEVFMSTAYPLLCCAIPDSVAQRCESAQGDPCCASVS
jgi:hypothetical protein